MQYKIQSPLEVFVTKKKKFILNLNNYRNANFFLLNNAKKSYKEAVREQLKELPRFDKIKLTYVYYPNSNRRYDISNICSIVDKFFSDALVETGHLEDDNYYFIPSVLYLMGKVDKDNPRVEILIEDVL